MKPGDKVIFKGGSSQHPIIVKGTIFLWSDRLLVQDEQGIVYNPIGWKIETSSNNNEEGKQDAE